MYLKYIIVIMYIYPLLYRRRWRRDLKGILEATISKQSKHDEMWLLKRIGSFFFDGILILHSIGNKMKEKRRSSIGNHLLLPLLELPFIIWKGINQRMNVLEKRGKVKKERK